MRKIFSTVIACWSPYIIFDLLQVFNKIPKTQSSIAVASFIQSLAPLNSAANPLIYCLFSTQIWKNIRYIIRNNFFSFHCCYKMQTLIKIYDSICGFRRSSLFRWCSNFCCCVKREKKPKSQFTNGRLKGGSNRNVHQNYDSMRTTTTSLSVSTSKHSNCVRPNRVIIVERPKSFLREQDEVGVQ